MTETFRLRKSVKYEGMALAAIFLCILFGYLSIFFLKEPAKYGFQRPHSAAIVGGMGLALFGTMLLVSIYSWATYYVEQLTIIGTRLSIRSMFQNREFDVSEIQSLKWSIYPRGGFLILRVVGSTTHLGLNGYSDEDRLRIIRALHALVPQPVQEGWPMFCHMVALPLQDGPRSILRSQPSLEFCRVTRKRYDRIFACVLPVSVVLAVYAWVWLNYRQFSALPFVVLGLWLFVRFNVPPEGRDEVRLTSRDWDRTNLFALGMITCAPLLIGVLPFVGVPKTTALFIGFVPLLVALPPVLYSVHKAGKLRQDADARAAESAPALWEQCEHGEQNGTLQPAP